MKKLREMKKNNKGFSLVELIVVIAIMVVLIAVLGSTILGYVEKSKYSKDIQALDSIKTACTTYAVDPEAKYTSNTEYKLSDLMTTTMDPYNIIVNTLKETFKLDAATSKYVFQSSSEAFKGITADDVKVKIVDGAVSIKVDSKKTDYKDYIAGSEYTAD